MRPPTCIRSGSLLYELLIGTVPFDAARMRQAGLNEMLRIIREEEAPTLSRKLTATGEAAAGIAAHRQTNTASLRRLVEGDLNWITMKALEKPRERRYASVTEFAADIQRYMEHRPVLASPPGRLYRLRKFVRRRRAAVLATAVAFAFILLSGVTAWSLSHRDSASRPKLTDKDTLVLADFDNKTGDPVFDDTLRQGLSVELQQSPFLALISDGKVQQELRLMGQPKDARLTPEIAQQVCERTASAAVLEGSITLVGSQYVLGLRAKDCKAGNVLDQEQAVAAKREDVLNSLSEIGRKFRIRVGESLATVEKHSTPLAEATTESLEALKAYSTGMKKAVGSSGNLASMPFYRRAVEIDPKFAIAYANLGMAYSGVGDSVLSAENATRAWQLRDRVSDRERFFIDFTYDRQVTGDLEKAYQTLETWYQTYPRGVPPHPQNLLGGVATLATGRFERAIETDQKQIAAEPDVTFGYSNLASSYFFLDRFSEAESTLQQASERKLELDVFRVLRYNIAMLKGDREQMDRLVDLAKGKRGLEHWMAHEEALALARSGRLQAARRSSKRAVDLALQEGHREAAATYQAARAVWEAVSENVAEGRRTSTEALRLSKGRNVQYAAGLALALSGDSSQSEATAGDLEKNFPEDTFVKFTYAPVLRALAALGAGQAIRQRGSAANHPSI